VLNFLSFLLPTKKRQAEILPVAVTIASIHFAHPRNDGQATLARGLIPLMATHLGSLLTWLNVYKVGD